MKRIENLPHAVRPGSALVLSLIFIVIFSALAAAMATISGANLQMAENHRRLDNTRASAESGLEVLRYWMSQVEMSGTIDESQRFSTLATTLWNLVSAADANNIMNTLICNSSTITVSDVPLNSSRGQSFSATLTSIDANNVQLDVTGYYGSLSRTIRSNYVFGIRANNVFDFGVASKGPLVLSGSVEIEGVNVNIESNAYIETNTSLALSISGNSHIAGNVKIVNPLATVFLGPKAGVGGATGAEAMKNIEIGAGPSEFPEMVTGPFLSYATNVLGAGVDLKKDVTLTNLRIPAGRNPKFSGNATLRGVVLIETPNIVEFTGGVNITGVIVTNGDQSDDSKTNQLIFRGNVSSQSVAQLPQEAQFTGLHNKTGTFIIAPGFAVSFGGSFSALNGVIAANGVEFFGDAGGIINGSVINYANRDMDLWGNSSLQFNRSGLTEVPAGFVPEIVLHYDPSSYSEPVL